MKRYYILTNRGNLMFLGEFANFSEAWDFADYEIPTPFVWLFKEENLEKLRDEIDIVLGDDK